MPTITVFDNQQIHMDYYTDTKIIHHQYFAGLNSHFLRAGLDRGVELLKEYGANKWLSDNREINAHSPEDTEWINTNWLPRAVAAGWKYWALVVPEAVLAQINMIEFVEAFYEQGIRVMVFTDPVPAMQWLQTVDQQVSVR